MTLGWAQNRLEELDASGLFRGAERDIDPDYGTRRKHSMIEKRLKRPYRKVYKPVNIDYWDPRVLNGQTIEPGTIVTVTHHVGPFRWIIDEHGNEMTVFKNSLDPVSTRS